MKNRKLVRIAAIVLVASAAIVGMIQLSATPASATGGGCVGSCLAWCIDDGGSLGACWSGCRRVCPK